MMILINRLTIFIITVTFLLSGALCGLAQSQDQQMGKDKHERFARIMYYAAPSGAPESAVVYQPKVEPQEVPLDKWNFSKSFKLAEGVVELSFVPTLLADNAPIPSGAPTLVIPEDWEKVLILVEEDRENPVMPIRFKAMNASDNEFGPGKTVFINFSEVTINGKVGEKDLYCEPDKTVYVSKPISGKGNYMIKLYASIGIRSWPVVQQRAPFFPDQRIVTLILPLPAPRLVKLYSAPIRNF